jgi:hypothetical protein
MEKILSEQLLERMGKNRADYQRKPQGAARSAKESAVPERGGR